MSFAAPAFLVVLAAVPLLWVLFRFADQRRRSALRRFVGDKAAAHTHAARRSRARRWSYVAISAFFCFLVLALMQPQWGRRAEESPRTGRDIVVLLDTSLSMLAEDAAPNRFEAAKLAIRGLAEAVRADGGHRLALIAFSGRPSLQSPLTLDYDLFLDRLDATRVGVIAYEGSALGSAIAHALDRLALRPGFADLILISDGEDHAGIPLDGAAAAAAAGVDLYTLGIGDPDEGALIPIMVDGKRVVIEYDGFPVRSRVDDDLLAEMARLTGGRFLGTDGDPRVLERLYGTTLRDKPVRALEQTLPEVPAHRYQWFALVAFLLLAADQAASGYRRRKA